MLSGSSIICILLFNSTENIVIKLKCWDFYLFRELLQIKHSSEWLTYEITTHFTDKSYNLRICFSITLLCFCVELNNYIQIIYELTYKDTVFWQTKRVSIIWNSLKLEPSFFYVYSIQISSMRKSPILNCVNLGVSTVGVCTVFFFGWKKLIFYSNLFNECPK